MSIRIKYTFVVLLCAYTYLFAQQNPQPFYLNYSTEDGLPSPEVYCAFEDSKGHMWFGTDNGVARFDGYKFKNYGAQEGLLNNVIFDIYEDEKNRLWFGSMTGDVFILEGDTILPYQYNHLITGFKGKYNVSSLAFLDKKETAYLGLDNYGLLTIDKNGIIDTFRGQFSDIMLVADLDDSKQTVGIKLDNYPSGNIFSIGVFTSQDRFQLSLPSYGTIAYSITPRKIPSGELLLSYGNYIYCIKNKQLLWSSPFPNEVANINLDDRGNIWICLLNGQGIRRYTSLEALKQNKYDLYLDGFSISNILEDSNGAYWVCSQEQGVFYLPDINVLTYDTGFGLSDDFVTSVVFRNDKELFVGLFNEDVFEVNLTNNTTSKLFSSQQTFHTPSLLYDKRNDQLWGGTYYYKSTKKEGSSSWTYELNNIRTYGNEALDNLHFINEDYLIGNTPPFGLYVLDAKNDSVIYSARKDTLKSRVYGLYTDYNDRIWVSKVNGLFEFRDSSFIRPGVDHPAFYHRIEDIDELPDSSLVLGTKGYGVSVWKNDNILQVTTKDGLTSNMIEDVHVSENGILWVGTLNGLNKITFDQKGLVNIRQFTVSNGLPSNEIYEINDYQGQVWLCTNKGLVRFHEKVENTIAITPNIQWVKVNNKKIEWQSGQLFHHNENSFEISYLSINYRLNGQINYRYRINEVASWQYTQNLSVNYPSLPSGQYTFEVQAQNEDQYWSNSSRYLFMVKAPWWQAGWIKLLAFFLLVLIGYAFYLNRVKKIKRETALQNQMLNLEKSALQAQMSPHFIFNCLNSIQNFILKNDKKKAVEYLSRFATLVRHNLDASIKGKVSLGEEVEMLDNYLALEKERFNHRFDYKISIEEELSADFVEFPTMLVQPFVENAVIHGMANKQEGGLITVDFNMKAAFLQVIVFDNGKGINQTANKKDLLLHKSAGVNITKKRLELLGVNSGNTINIEEMRNEAGEVEGTKVEVLIKVRMQKE